MSGGISYALPGRQSEDAPSEDIDDALREVDELLEGWNNRLSIKNLAIAERYAEAVLEFGIVFVARVGDQLTPTDFVAVFERKLPINSAHPHHRGGRVVFGARSPNVELYSEHLMRCGHGDEQLVFVGDVETVQTPECVLPSEVRLQSLDYFDRVCGRTIDPRYGAGPEVANVRTYWEACVVAGRCASFLDQFDSKQIERRPKIVDAVAQDRAPFVGDGDVEPEAVNFVRGLRFFIDHDAIRMERVKGIDGRFEVQKMFFGPVDLYPASDQRVAHVKARSDERP
jgi:hypothetical protein